MFHKLVCLLLACLKIMACASPPFTGSIARTKIPLAYTANLNSKPNIQNNLLLHKFYRGYAEKQIHMRPDRSKRGIVLIDEDFNVPPDPGVKQGWSDGDLHPDKMGTNATRIYSEGEGSGSSETMDQERVFTKSTRFATLDNLQLTSLLDPQATADANPEASGDGDISMISSTTETSEDVISVVTPSTHASSSTQVPEMITSSRHVSTSTAAPEDTSEGISSTHVPVIPRKDIDDSYEHLCLNLTCDSKDLIILPSLSETVPEGTNLTLSCSPANSTEQGSLKWYKYNESDYLLLEEYSNGHEIHFPIPKTILYHSGTYVCFRFTEQSCCHRKLDITVYEMPDYKQHFIVIGSIAAASLLVCILIGICKSVKTKKYEDKVELQNVEKPFLL